MKPMMIYTVPRTRSSALLEASRRSIQLREPFSRHLTVEQWPELHANLVNSDSCVKFFGSQLIYQDYVRTWFNNAVETDSHDIFILMRDFREVCYSYIVAFVYGWGKLNELGPAKAATLVPAATYANFTTLHFEFGAFFDSLPKNGKVITFESAPSSHFDLSQISLENQHSLQKLERFSNRDFIERRVQRLYELFGERWNTLMNGNVGERFIPPLC